MKQHIGGSILPSSDAQVLKIKSGEHGVFQVRELPEQDTHALYFAKTVEDLGTNEIQIASHPNGYSCDTLAKRTISAWTDGTTDRVLDQFDYILICGGDGVERDIAEALANGHIDQVIQPQPGPSL
jgi:hypothetical protein